jgi:DNA ligase (NAD+)
MRCVRRFEISRRLDSGLLACYDTGMSNTKHEIVALSTAIKTAADLYYGDGPNISDHEYDALVDRLRALDPANPALAVVGAKVTRNKVHHIMPMMSLDKITTMEELVSFISATGERDFVVEPKMDGCALELQYEDGVLKRAVTRGDGIVGEDVTANAMRIKNIPRKINNLHPNACVRGEVLLSVANWKIVDPTQAKNPRNAGNGIIRRTDGENCHLLDFIAYDIMDEESFATEIQKLRVLENNGFTVIDYWACKTDQSAFATSIAAVAANIMSTIDSVLESRGRCSYHIDGCVVKVNSVAAYDRMGVSSNRPKAHKAFKWESDQAVSKLLALKLTVGHTGAVIPTGDIEPVELMGTTVSSVLLNNFAFIKNLDVAIGDSIVIIKAGEIIPYCKSVVFRPEDRTPIVEPLQCPVCGGLTARMQLSDEKTEGLSTICQNEKCSAKVTGKVGRWINSLNILGIGDELLETLTHPLPLEPVLSGALVQDAADIYDLTVDALTPLPMGNGQLGYKRATSIVAEIKKTATLTIDQFLGSLGICYLGKRKVEVIRGLAKGELDHLDAWMNGNALVRLSKQCQIEGVAPRIQAALQANADLISRLMQHITISTVTGSASIGPNIQTIMKPKTDCYTFVLTGKFDRPKAEIHAEITAAGHKFADELRKGEATHLVVADASIISSKSRKASSWGVPTITLDQLVKMLK